MTITDKQVEAALYAFQTWQGWCSVGGEGLARAKMRAALEAAEAERGGSVTLVGEPGVIMTKADYPNPGAPARLRPAVTGQEPAAQGEASIPFAYAYRFTDPLSGAPVWRLSSVTWNGQSPIESRALYLAPPASAPGVDVQALIEAVLPGGASCDPQRVADDIRAWFYERAAAAHPSAPSEPNAAWVNAVESYAAAARVIALYLERFCDQTLPYPEMIADASRKAAAEIERLSALPAADDARDAEIATETRRSALVQHAIKLMRQGEFDGKTFSAELTHTLHLLAREPRANRDADSASIELTGAEILEAARFVIPDWVVAGDGLPDMTDQLETPATIARNPPTAPPGLWIWLSEYPDEGAQRLDDPADCAMGGES